MYVVDFPDDNLSSQLKLKAETNSTHIKTNVKPVHIVNIDDDMQKFDDIHNFDVAVQCYLGDGSLQTVRNKYHNSKSNSHHNLYNNSWRNSYDNKSSRAIPRYYNPHFNYYDEKKSLLLWQS